MSEEGNTRGYSPAGGSAGAGQQSMKKRRKRKKKLVDVSISLRFGIIPR